ncbi:DUF2125 domain-containing protein [Chthonobacter albigriseus]|uniref:DUF2125 domain-containing protein n=1 Tax=Chthonobacter albigriseus TaxID=1683161 RepID=UPI0015EE6EBE|nr:DUF2125 domain-containing protein [Chthonobacter albigriseus]
MRGRFIALLVVLAAIVGGWTYAWTQVRDTVIGNVDRGIGDLASQGITVICLDRSVGGWPFRVSVSCRNPEITLPDGTHMSAAGLESNGSVNDPDLIVSRFAAPITFRAPTGEVFEGTFSALTTSFRPDPNGGSVPQVSIAAEDLAANVTAGGLDIGRVTARHVEAHLRSPASSTADVEFSATLNGAAGLVGTTDLLPEEADAGVLLRVRNGTMIDGTPDGLAAWAAAGGGAEVAQVAVEIGETRIEAEGSATVASDGAVVGTLTATATRIDWLTAQAAAGKPLNPVLAALGSAFALIGRAGEGEGNPRTLTIDMSNGAVTANGLPLGSAPRLF